MHKRYCQKDHKNFTHYVNMALQHATLDVLEIAAILADMKKQPDVIDLTVPTLDEPTHSPLGRNFKSIQVKGSRREEQTHYNPPINLPQPALFVNSPVDATFGLPVRVEADGRLCPYLPLNKTSRPDLRCPHCLSDFYDERSLQMHLRVFCGAY